MARPRVSVIIPAYNRAHLIGLTLESVRRQSYKDYEIVVVDDGSTDDTAKVVLESAPAARYLWQENVGVPEVLNVCVREAHGEYIGFLGSDDALLPGALERQVRALDENPNVGMVHGAVWLMDEGGRLTSVLKPPFATEDYVRSGREEVALLLMSNHIVAPTVMARRQAFDEVGLFDRRLGLYEDWNMWMRILGRWDIAYIDDPLTCYRVHTGEAGSIFRTAEPRRMERFRRICLNEALATADAQTRRKASRAAWARHHYIIATQAFFMGDGGFGRSNALRAVGLDPLGASGRASARLLARSSAPRFLVAAMRRARKLRGEQRLFLNARPTVEAALRGEALPER
jgi:glycosyltransferase involved in cell wall biosynthesis